MKRIQTTVLLAALVGSASAWAVKVPENLSIDSKTEVAYTCEHLGKPVPLTVMYGIKKGEPILAQIKINGQISPGLYRVPDVMVNRFVSAGPEATMWTTAVTRAKNLATTNGDMLSVEKDGERLSIARNCTVAVKMKK